MKLLRQSTAVDVPIGPFVDATDGVTPETGLTLTQPDIRLKKNAAAWAQKNAAQTLTHEENGNYEVALNATDTDTLGHLRLHVNEAGALPVWHDFLVVPADVYDALVSGSGNGLRASVQAMANGVLSAAAIGADAITAAKVAADVTAEFQSGLALATDLATVAAYVDELESRLTAARAGYLDKLNIAGSVASSGEVTAIQNNTRVNRSVPAVLERPDSGNVQLRIELACYDEIGNMEAPDAAPTLDVVNQAGTSRNGNLDSVNGALVTTGRYRWLYTVDSAHALEQLVLAFSVVEAGATRVYLNNTLVVDTTAVDFTSADRTKLDAVHAKLPSKLYLAGTTNSDGDVQLDEATGTPADPVGVGTLLARASEARLSELDTSAGKLAHDVAQILLTDRLTAGRAAAIDNLDAAMTTRATPGQVAAELATYDAPTAAELTAAVAAINTATEAALASTARAELGAVPAANASLVAKMTWLAMLARNAIEQTASEQRLKSDAGTTIAVAAVSDASGVLTRGEFAAP